MAILAAGILFLDPKGNALFLKRGPSGDAPGAWCFPGGRCEGEETAEACAVREAKEECGTIPAGERTLWARRSLVDPVVILGGPAAPEAAGLAQAAAQPQELVDFSTFLQRVDAQFTPTLDGEHVGYSWALADQPPEPLHPGCRVALAKLTMDEVGISRAIAAGELTSPQRYANVDLFAIRISGTGVAYRSEKKDEDGNVVQKEEFVYRRPENYLTPEFLARCNGMPVIMMHPESIVLDTDEFRKRIIGTILLPYVDGDEVWGIAKVFDMDAASMMRTEQLSTSPGVLLGKDNFQATLSDGRQILIEGKPDVVDHIAVLNPGVPGVWDKGGPLEGVISHEARKDSQMATKEEEETARRAADDAARAKHDAETDDKIGRLLGGLDAIAGMCKDMMSKHDALNERMDAFEKRPDARKDDDAAKKDSEASVAKYSARKDDDDDASYAKRHDAEEETEATEREAKGEPKEIAADKAKRHRKDAEEKDKERMDARRRHDSAVEAAVAARIADVEKQLGPIRAALKTRPDDERSTIAGIYVVTERIGVALGDSAVATHALPGEDVTSYRRRMLLPLRVYSPQWKDIDLSKLDDATLSVAETQIRHDAMAAADSPATAGVSGLRMRTERSPSGHIVNTFVGRPSAWMAPLAGPNRHYVKSWKTAQNRSAG